MNARFGYYQRFNSDTAGKFRVNQAGYIDLALKHRVSDVLTLGLVTGFNLKSAVVDKKGNSLPVGLSLDFKFWVDNQDIKQTNRVWLLWFNNRIYMLYFNIILKRRKLYFVF